MSAPRLETVATAVPEQRASQSFVRDAIAQIYADSPHLARILHVFDTTGIRERAFAAPVEWYFQPQGWRSRNAMYLEAGLPLASEAATRALAQAGIRAEDVDGIVFVSTTGIATPSLDARLVNRLGLRNDVLRLPVWGLGCGGGVAGLNRTADLARAHARKRFLLVCLELCSLSFRLHARTKRDLVAASLFADGCAAAVIAGPDAPTTDAAAAADAPRVRAGYSHVWHKSEDVMGWDVDDDGLGVVFSPEIPAIVQREAKRVFDALPDDARRPNHYAFHPGGTKVLAAYRESLGLREADVAHARAVLRDHGNMSSPTALFVLQRILHEHAHEPGERAVAAALGPGFASELSLLAWDAA